MVSLITPILFLQSKDHKLRVTNIVTFAVFIAKLVVEENNLQAFDPTEHLANAYVFIIAAAP